MCHVFHYHLQFYRQVSPSLRSKQRTAFTSKWLTKSGVIGVFGINVPSPPISKQAVWRERMKSSIRNSDMNLKRGVNKLIVPQHQPFTVKAFQEHRKTFHGKMSLSARFRSHKPKPATAHYSH